MGDTNIGGDAYSNTNLLATKVAARAYKCRLFNLNIYNPSNAVAYVQFFDAASGDVTVGSTTPTRVIALPTLTGISTAHYQPFRFNTALTIAATTTATGNTAPNVGLLIDFDTLGF